MLPRPPASPFARDALLAAVLSVAAEVQVALDPDLSSRERVGYALVLLATAAVAWRRRAPLAAAAAFALSEPLTFAALGTRDQGFFVGVVVAALVVGYSVAAHEPDRRRAAAGLVLMLGAFWLNDLRVGNPPSELLASATLTIGPWVAGRLIGAARHQTEQLRAANAELATQRALAREAAAAAERARIARELHDIVAHSLSVIALQAEAAAGLIDVRPQDAERRVETVRTTARGALEEMRRLLGHLREDEALGATLARVDQLADAARQAGAEVALDVRGAAQALPAAVDVSAYRIVQEGLTNARRHADGAPCAVRVDCSETAVDICVRNGPAPRGLEPAARTPGYGLVGIQERVSALGGTLAAGPRPDGGWELRAQLPLATARA